MAEPHEAEVLIRTPDFIIRLTPPALKFESVGSIDDMEHSLEEWAELLRALRLMATGRATLTTAGNDRIPSITFPVDQPITGPYLEELPLISAFLDGWIRLSTNEVLRSTARYFKFDVFWEGYEATDGGGYLGGRSEIAGSLRFSRPSRLKNRRRCAKVCISTARHLPTEQYLQREGLLRTVR